MEELEFRYDTQLLIDGSSKKDLNEDKERFRKLGLTFEEMAFYDILIKMRDEKDVE